MTKLTSTAFFVAAALTVTTAATQQQPQQQPSVFRSAIFNTHHGMRFTATCLAIGENCTVIAFEDRFN